MYRFAMGIAAAMITVALVPATAPAQENGVIRGTVTLLPSGEPVPGAVIRITGTGAVATTDALGAFEFTGLPAGAHEVVAEHPSFPTDRRVVTVIPDGVVSADFEVQMTVRESVQVTAELPRYETDFAAVGKAPVAILDTPTSIQVVERRLIEDQGVAEADEIHRNLAGISASPYASVVTRGFTQRDFVFNGVRGNPYGSLGGDVMNSGFSVSQLQLTNIERVEVLKGPASVLYGSNEPGGVLNYVTRKPREEFDARATVRFGQYDQLGGSAEVTGPIGNTDRVLYRVAAYANQRDSFRQNAGSENRHLVGNLEWRLGDETQLGLEFENIDQDLRGHRLRGVPVDPDGDFLTDITWTATEPTDFAQLDAQVFQARLDRTLGDEWALDATVRYLSYDRAQQYHEPRRVNPDDTMQRAFRDQERTNDDVAAVVNLNRSLRLGATRHWITVGADLFRQDHTFRYAQARQSGSGGPVPDLHLRNPQYGLTSGAAYGLTEDAFSTDTATALQTGLFVQDHVDFGDSVHLLLGGRVGRYEDAGLAGGNDLESNELGLTGRIGVVYKPRDEWSLYGSFANAFNRPSILSQTPSANGPHDPETATQFEIGAKTALAPDLSLTAAAFTITKGNVLRPDPDYGPDGNNWNAVLQVGQVRNRGFEIELLGAIGPTWDLALNYAWLDSEIIEDLDPGLVGEPLPNAAPHAVGLFTRFGVFREISAGFGMTHLGERIEPYAGIRAPAYTVFDLHAYRPLGRFAEVHLKLENILDTVYATSSLFAARAGNFPGQPRTLSVLVTIGGPR